MMDDSEWRVAPLLITGLRGCQQTQHMNVWLKWGGLGALALVVVIQFFPVDRDNPTTQSGNTIYDKENLPPDIREIFQRSCSDCHSNRTVWPWYSHVAPVSWVIASDVHGARRQMNLSEWGSYPPKKRADKLDEICEQVGRGDMPDPKYAFIHPQAKLTSEQRKAVCAWTDSNR